LALYLVNRGGEITLYCLHSGDKLTPNTWKGINLVHIPTPNNGALWSMIFDYKSTIHALKEDGIVLVLEYNTAIFSLLYRLKGRTVLTKMDGMEWWREKWNGIQKSWLFINERCGVWFSDRTIADRPQKQRSTLWISQTASPFKRIVGQYCPNLVRAKSAIFGSGTARNK